MSQRKNLLEVSYHSDDEAGMYEVGEIDFGISGELDDYLERYGQKGMDNILKALAHLTWHVQQYGYPIIHKKRTNHENQPTKPLE